MFKDITNIILKASLRPFKGYFKGPFWWFCKDVFKDVGKNSIQRKENLGSSIESQRISIENLRISIESHRISIKNLRNSIENLRIPI